MEKPSYFLYLQLNLSTGVKTHNLTEYLSLNAANKIKKEYEDFWNDNIEKCYIIKGWRMS